MTKGIIELGSIINAISTVPDVYYRAVNKFGIDHQTRKAETELTELLHALMKYSEGKASLHDVRDEIADCFIMLVQLAIIFGVELVAAQIIRKAERLADNMKGGEHGEL